MSDRERRTSTSSPSDGKFTGTQALRPWSPSDRRPNRQAYPWHHNPSTWPASFGSSPPERLRDRAMLGLAWISDGTLLRLPDDVSPCDRWRRGTHSVARTRHDVRRV